QNGVAGVDGIAGINALAASPDGRHVYALGATSNTLAVFSRNPNPGSAGFGRLSFVQAHANGQGGLSGLGAPRWVGLNGDGSRLFVLAAGSGTLASVARDGGSGALTPQGAAREGQDGAQGLLGARSARLAGDGQHIYVASPQSDAIAHFRVSAAGAPQFAG